MSDSWVARLNPWRPQANGSNQTTVFWHKPRWAWDAWRLDQIDLIHCYTYMNIKLESTEEKIVNLDFCIQIRFIHSTHWVSKIHVSFYFFFNSIFFIGNGLYPSKIVIHWDGKKSHLTQYSRTLPQMGWKLPA